jgi:hypothetical protein
VNVVRLVQYKCRETVAILKVMLTMALDGRLRGAIVCYRADSGEEKVVFTGIYKAQPGKAMGLILSTSVNMMRANGDMD